MNSTLNRYLRGVRRNGFNGFATRAACAALLALLLPAAAFAYTIVLRGGRRVEIPADFTVTKLTLTYESAPGINITIQMSTIDIAATEQANNEPSGALLRRAEQVQSLKATTTPARQPRRELTKQDIEAARLARQRSEQEYERRRQELGLPSLEETRRRNAEETERLKKDARQRRMEVAEAESYWRTRAAELRAELAALDAQINYVRASLSETPEYSAAGAYGFVTGFVPGFPRRHPATRFPVVTGHPGFMRGNGAGTQVAGFLAFGGSTTQGRVQLNTGFAGRGFGRRGLMAPGAVYLGSPYSYDYAYDRAGLVLRLRELETARAGLQARWSLLEDEARRAGAPPGWLRQ
ncbi:MAG TPA: hypothetical protein VJT09_02660 [Pyrinomonadaceae bacterium]|nr:hypothetical protein [Pyrinomonadaceae bacterium]